jgi:hypothetical protein
MSPPLHGSWLIDWSQCVNSARVFLPRLPRLSGLDGGLFPSSTAIDGAATRQLADIIDICEASSNFPCPVSVIRFEFDQCNSYIDISRAGSAAYLKS